MEKPSLLSSCSHFLDTEPEFPYGNYAQIGISADARFLRPTVFSQVVGSRYLTFKRTFTDFLLILTTSLPDSSRSSIFLPVLEECGRDLKHLGVHAYLLVNGTSTVNKLIERILVQRR